MTRRKAARRSAVAEPSAGNGLALRTWANSSLGWCQVTSLKRHWALATGTPQQSQRLPPFLIIIYTPTKTPRSLLQDEKTGSIQNSNPLLIIAHTIITSAVTEQRRIINFKIVLKNENDTVASDLSRWIGSRGSPGRWLRWSNHLKNANEVCVTGPIKKNGPDLESREGPA